MRPEHVRVAITGDRADVSFPVDGQCVGVHASTRPGELAGLNQRLGHETPPCTPV